MLAGLSCFIIWPKPDALMRLASGFMAGRPRGRHWRINKNSNAGEEYHRAMLGAQKGVHSCDGVGHINPEVHFHRVKPLQHDSTRLFLHWDFSDRAAHGQRTFKMVAHGKTSGKSIWVPANKIVLVSATHTCSC